MRQSGFSSSETTAPNAELLTSGTSAQIVLKELAIPTNIHNIWMELRWVGSPKSFTHLSGIAVNIRVCATAACLIRNLSDAFSTKQQESHVEMPISGKLPCYVILKKEIRPHAERLATTDPQLDMSRNPLNCGSITLSQL
ncbi:uncharacterized protein LOC129739561 [Uranotaenia lowii]|uniref:uncharacterized protein LOC129739561 n=1 Tax=Uranotaenia lowii TaxID=190385 RepID=UPI00247AC2F5|nr:uncharacterized protein LOC129739561 [Uranotaenia lowii]